jgi:EAL domain-containing protein (putative c-di-GMP-specific phosphodiesterase class I)
MALGFGEHPRTAAIVRSIVELAHSLGLRVVAGGVEDLGTVEVLQGYGCAIVQGFFYRRPRPVAPLTAWIARGPAAERSRRVYSRPPRVDRPTPTKMSGGTCSALK